MVSYVTGVWNDLTPDTQKAVKKLTVRAAINLSAKCARALLDLPVRQQEEILAPEDTPADYHHSSMDSAHEATFRAGFPYTDVPPLPPIPPPGLMLQREDLFPSLRRTPDVPSLSLQPLSRPGGRFFDEPGLWGPYSRILSARPPYPQRMIASDSLSTGTSDSSLQWFDSAPHALHAPYAPYAARSVRAASFHAMPVASPAASAASAASAAHQGTSQLSMSIPVTVTQTCPNQFEVHTLICCSLPLPFVPPPLQISKEMMESQQVQAAAPPSSTAFSSVPALTSTSASLATSSPIPALSSVTTLPSTPALSPPAHNQPVDQGAPELKSDNPSNQTDENKDEGKKPLVRFKLELPNQTIFVTRCGFYEVKVNPEEPYLTVKLNDAKCMHPSVSAKEKDDIKGKCTVCYDNAADHVFVPCGHQALCSDCRPIFCAQALEKRKCPICRIRYEQVIRVFLCGAP